MPPPPSYRKRRRALEFLEAHGFKIELLVELVRVGLATASSGCSPAGDRSRSPAWRSRAPAGGRLRRFDGLDPQARIGLRLWDEWNDDDYNGVADGSRLAASWRVRLGSGSYSGTRAGSRPAARRSSWRRVAPQERECI